MQAFAMPKRRHRPRKPKGELKDEEIRVRVTADQKQALVDAASRESMEVSSWLRWLGMKAAKGEIAVKAQVGA